MMRHVEHKNKLEWQWSKYCMTSLVIKCLKLNETIFLVKTLGETPYFEGRAPHIGKFYDNSNGKIGRLKFGNNLNLMSAINFERVGLELSDAAIITSLQRTFFSYIMTPTTQD